MSSVIAAGEKVTAEAAREVLWLGGNAFDAAVAAVFTAMVAEPTLTSAGGGGHFLAVPSQGRPILFDFFVDMPSGDPEGRDLDFFPVDVDFGDAVQTFFVGRGAAAVPGNVAGLLHVQERLGRLPRREVLGPAVRAAGQGVPLSRQQAYLIRILSPILTHGEGGARIFAPEGQPLQEGDRLWMPEFAGFLESLAREGPDLF